MKKLLSCLLCLLFLTGCGKEQSQENTLLQLRSKLQECGCTFSCGITVDYGDCIYTFGMNCAYAPGDGLQFTVIEPESIMDISGRITEGKLRFDDVSLYFDLLADGMLSPVSAPWVVMQAITGGYLHTTGREEALLRVTLRDSYREDAFTVELWLKEEIPVSAEIYWEGRRILTLEIEDFVIQ